MLDILSNLPVLMRQARMALLKDQMKPLPPSSYVFSTPLVFPIHIWKIHISMQCIFITTSITILSRSHHMKSTMELKPISFSFVYLVERYVLILPVTEDPKSTIMYRMEFFSAMVPRINIFVILMLIIILRKLLRNMCFTRLTTQPLPETLYHKSYMILVTHMWNLYRNLEST